MKQNKVNSRTRIVWLFFILLSYKGGVEDEKRKSK